MPDVTKVLCVKMGSDVGNEQMCSFLPPCLNNLIKGNKIINNYLKYDINWFQ